MGADTRIIPLTLADHARLILTRLGSPGGAVIVLLPDLHCSPDRWLRPDGLAVRLAMAGMDVFVLAWRGTAGSWPQVHRRSGHGLAELAGLDLPGVAARIRQLRPGAALGWLAEGAAALPLWQFCAEAPQQVSRLAFLDLAVSPLTGWRGWLARGSLLLKGYVATRRLHLGGCDLSAPLWRDIQRGPDIGAWIASHGRDEPGQSALAWPPSLYWQDRSPAQGRAALQHLLAMVPAHETRIHWSPQHDTDQLASILAGWHTAAIPKATGTANECPA